jgi:hypothetical protein
MAAVFPGFSFAQVPSPVSCWSSSGNFAPIEPLSCSNLASKPCTGAVFCTHLAASLIIFPAASTTSLPWPTAVLLAPPAVAVCSIVLNSALICWALICASLIILTCERSKPSHSCE